MDWIFLRHAESVANSEKRLQGRADSPLTDRGRAQVDALARWCMATGLTWTRTYASPLSRARETAERLVARAAPNAGPVLLCEDLAEVAVGALEGLTLPEVLSRHRDFDARPVTEFGDFARYGGESHAEIQCRVARVRQTVDRDREDSGDVVLIVSHGGLIRQFVKSLVATPIPAVAGLRTENCTLTRVAMVERFGRELGEIVWHLPLELIVQSGPWYLESSADGTCTTG